MTSLVAATPSMSVMMMIGMTMFKRFPGRHPSWFVALFLSVFTFAIVFAALNAVMVQWRIRSLKQDKRI